MTLRSALYGLARLMGDINAIHKGTVDRRIKRRIAGKVVGRTLMRRIK